MPEVFIHPGSVKFGYFCPDCCTPTVIAIPYYWVTPDGVTVAPANVTCTACHKKFLQLAGGHNGPQ